MGAFPRADFSFRNTPALYVSLFYYTTFLPLPSNRSTESTWERKRGGRMGVERGPFSPLFSSYDPFSSRFLVGFCHLQTHLTASLRGQNVLGGEALLLCSTFTCLQHPILLYYTCCIKTGTTENLSPPNYTSFSAHG